MRTPLAWDAGPGGGFTTGSPWLPLDPAYRTRNVATLREDPRSILTLHRRLLALRRARPALATGAIEDVRADGEILRYTRVGEGGPCVVLLNLSHRPVRADPLDLRGGRLLLSTHLDREGQAAGGSLRLRPDEGLIVGLPGAQPGRSPGASGGAGLG